MILACICVYMYNQSELSAGHFYIRFTLLPNTVNDVSSKLSLYSNNCIVASCPLLDFVQYNGEVQTVMFIMLRLNKRYRYFMLYKI